MSSTTAANHAKFQIKTDTVLHSSGSFVLRNPCWRADAASDDDIVQGEAVEREGHSWWID